MPIEVEYVKSPPNPLTALVTLVASLLFFIPWIMGIVLAKGFWLTLTSIFIFPYAWYLTAERLMQLAGIIP